MPWICAPDALPCVYSPCAIYAMLPWLAVSDPSELSMVVTQLRLHFAVQGINVFFNFLASFIIGQFFNTMLCSMQVASQATINNLLPCSNTELDHLLALCNAVSGCRATFAMLCIPCSLL